MSTQSYTPNHQATSQQGSGPSWFRVLGSSSSARRLR